MCYSIEELQQIIDNEYKGNMKEAIKHIENCPVCKVEFERLQESETLIKDVLGMNMNLPPRPIINSKIIENERNIRRIFKMNKLAKRCSAAAAAVVICAGMFSIEPIRAKAQDFLKMFRVQEVKGIAISQEDIYKMDQLIKKGEGKQEIGNFISVDVKSQGQEEIIKQPTFETLKEKSKNSKIIKAPEGYKYDEGASIFPSGNITLKLDVKKANDLLNYLGEDVKLPNSLDEKPIIINTNETVAYSMNQGDKYISVGKTDVPTLQIPKDIDEKEVVSALLSMNLLPDNLKKQLSSIEDLTSTLPVPYSPEHQTKKDIKINGTDAILIQDKDSKHNNVTICFKENDALYIVNSYNVNADEIVSLVEGMK